MSDSIFPIVADVDKPDARQVWYLRLSRRGPNLLRERICCCTTYDLRPTTNYSRTLASFYGPVAQLGARHNGIVEVRGSTPLWSITLC